MSDWGNQGAPAGQHGRVKVPVGPRRAAAQPSIADMKPIGYHADGTPFWVHRTHKEQQALDDAFIAAVKAARSDE